MAWVDDSNQPVSDALILNSLGASPPAATPTPQSGNWVDDSGQPVTDPLIAKSLGSPVPEQMTGAMRYPAMVGSNLAKGAGTSFGITGDLQSLIYNKNNFPGYVPPPTNVEMGYAQPPTSAEMLNVLRNDRVIDRPNLAPQNETEKVVSAASQGVGSALPFLPLAALAGPAAIAPALISSATGGVGSMYGGEIGSSLGHPMLGSVIGGLSGGFLGGGLTNAATKGTNALLGNYGELGSAYQSAGVPIRMAGDVSGNPTLNAIQAYSSKSLGGAGRTQSAANDVVNAYGNSVNDTASQLGTSSSLQELGDTAQNAGNNWLANFKATSNAKHAAVDAAIGQTASVQPTATQDVLDSIRGSAHGNDAAEAFLKSPAAKDVGSVLAGSQDGTLPWQTARAVRTRLGEYLENPAMVADAGGAQVKRLYGALSDDLKSTAAASISLDSPNANAAQLFADANAYTSSGHGFIDNVLSKFMGKPPAQAAQTIVNSAKTGDHILGPIRQQMPDLADEVGAFKLRDMALARDGQQNAAGTQVSPGSFLTDLNALSPEGRAALYPNPAVAAKIDALAKISEGVKKTQTMVNTSNTGPALSPQLMFDAGLAGGWAGHSIAGMPGAAAGFITGAAGLPIYNRLFSYLGANRPLASMMAAQGSGIPRGVSLLLGGNAGMNPALSSPQGPLKIPQLSQ